MPLAEPSIVGPYPIVMIVPDHDDPRGRDFDFLPDAWITIPVIETLRAVAARYPDRAAIRDRESAVSYRELIADMDRIASAIAQCPTSCRAVGLLLPNTALHPIAALACLAAGRVFVPFDTSHPAARIADLVRELALDAVLFAGENTWLPADLRPDLPRLDVLEILRVPAVAPPPPDHRPDPDDAVAILHTSGSTGRPKAIVISQASLLERIRQHVNALEIGPLDQLCPLSSPCTISGKREQFAALLTGATLHVVDPHLAGLATLRRTIAERSISIVYAIPALMRAILQAGGRSSDLASLRAVRVAGDTVLWPDLSLMRRSLPASCRIQIGFSATEWPGMEWFVPDDFAAEEQAVPVGRPVPGIRVEVLGPDGRPVAPGQFGELVVRSRFVALGLWQDGACRPGPFATDPERSGERIHASGDLVALRPDGMFLHGGRLDRQANIRGQRVDISEIEAALHAVASVADAVVLAVAEGDRQAIVAFVQAQPGIEPATVLQQVQQRLAAFPEFMWPSRRHLSKAIPRLPSGKPDVAALREIDHAHGSTVVPPDPEAASGTRVIVARAWSRLLGAGSTGTSWSDAGGDSLRLLELALALEQRLGRVLPLELFDSAMRLDGLVQAIDRLLQARHVVAPGGSRPRVLFFPGIEDDNPALARFREGLSQQADFETVSYPSWQAMVRDGGGLDRFIELACDRILAEPSHPALHLAGYSFGGVVALGLARRLEEKGRTVACLTVFDTNLENFIGPDATEGPWEPGWKRRLADRCIGLGFGGLTSRRHRPLRLPLPRHLKRSTDLLFRWKLRRGMAVAWLRRSGRSGLPTRVAAPVILFRTDDHPEASSRDLGWSGFAGPVSVQDVDGSHLTMFWPPHSIGLAARFAQLCLGPATEPLVDAATATDLDCAA